MHVKKIVTMFNFADPCQKFVFEGDVIKHVQTFKYLRILLKTTLNLDSAVEHLVTTSRRSLFALKNHCAELCIMDVKLCCDFFNTLVHSTASYVCELWVDSKKIEAIEVVYQGFLKCRNPTLEEWEDDSHTPEMGTWEFVKTPEILKFTFRGQNTLY